MFRRLLRAGLDVERGVDKTALLLQPGLLDALRAIKAREGIPVTTQIEFAIRDWLQKKDVTQSALAPLGKAAQGLTVDRHEAGCGGSFNGTRKCRPTTLRTWRSADRTDRSRRRATHVRKTDKCKGLRRRGVRQKFRECRTTRGARRSDCGFLQWRQGANVSGIHGVNDAGPTARKLGPIDVDGAGLPCHRVHRVSSR